MTLVTGASSTFGAEPGNVLWAPKRYATVTSHLPGLCGESTWGDDHAGSRTGRQGADQGTDDVDANRMGLRLALDVESDLNAPCRSGLLAMRSIPPS